MQEPWLQPFIDDIAGLGKKAVAYDIGANAGEWTRWLGGQFSHVLALEPDHRAYQALLSVRPKNCLALRAAAAGFSGAAEFFIRESSLQSSLLKDHPFGHGGSVTQSVSLLAMDLQRLHAASTEMFKTDEVNFIKIDIEGAEVEVLSAAIAGGVFSRAAWLIECHGTLDEVCRQLGRLGYSEMKAIKNADPNHAWVYAR
jgi:hypothetical protein